MSLCVNIAFDVFYIIITYGILYHPLSKILSVHALPNALTYFSQGYSYTVLGGDRIKTPGQKPPGYKPPGQTPQAKNPLDKNPQNKFCK